VLITMSLKPNEWAAILIALAALVAIYAGLHVYRRGRA